MKCFAKPVIYFTWQKRMLLERFEVVIREKEDGSGE